MQQFCIQRVDLRGGLRRADVQQRFAPRPQGAVAAGQGLDLCVKHERRGNRVRLHQHVSTHYLVLVDAREVDRGTVARADFLDGLAVNLDPADPHPFAPRHDLQFVIYLNGPRQCCTGYHRADTLDAERAVDGHAEAVPQAPAADPRGSLVQGAGQLVNAIAGN